MRDAASAVREPGGPVPWAEGESRGWRERDVGGREGLGEEGGVRTGVAPLDELEVPDGDAAGPAQASLYIPGG